MNRLSKCFVLFIVLTVLSDCSVEADNSPGDLFNYKDSYVGDNSAVVNTVIHLQGVDWVMLKFETVDGVEEFKLTREELEGWYKVNLSEIESEEKLKELIQAHVDNSEEVTQFLK
ncbi:MAG: DUF4825 domain-containing protein [Planococcus donghaensis]